MGVCSLFKATVSTEILNSWKVCELSESVLMLAKNATSLKVPPLHCLLWTIFKIISS